jgi:hypothetical protein
MNSTALVWDRTTIRFFVDLEQRLNRRYVSSLKGKQFSPAKLWP